MERTFFEEGVDLVDAGCKITLNYGINSYFCTQTALL